MYLLAMKVTIARAGGDLPRARRAGEIARRAPRSSREDNKLVIRGHARPSRNQLRPFYERAVAVVARLRPLHVSNDAELGRW